MIDKLNFVLKDRGTRWMLAGLVMAGLLLALMAWMDQAQNKVETPDRFTADTVIPKGFVLVPIEIQNLESLSSMIGNFGVIDLFTTPQLHQKSGIRVGRHLKLLRAPLNPQQFAVLVPENEAHAVLESSGPFTAVIQNPDDTVPSEVIKAKKPQQVVEYLKGSRSEK